MSKHESLCDALDALTDKEGYPIPYTGTAASVIRNQDAEIERLRAALELAQDHLDGEAWIAVDLALTEWGGEK